MFSIFPLSFSPIYILHYMTALMNLEKDGPMTQAPIFHTLGRGWYSLFLCSPVFQALHILLSLRTVRDVWGNLRTASWRLKCFIQCSCFLVVGTYSVVPIGKPQHCSNNYLRKKLLCMSEYRCRSPVKHVCTLLTDQMIDRAPLSC